MMLSLSPQNRRKRGKVVPGIPGAMETAGNDDFAPSTFYIL